MNRRDQKDEITAYNNTHYWEHEGRGFIDSLKYTHVFSSLAKKIGLADFKIEHEVKEEKANWSILGGEDSTGLVFGGKKTNCNVFSFKLSEE